VDCPTSGGGFPPTTPPKEEIPPAAPAAEKVPEKWPEPTKTAAAIGATVPIPQDGTTIVLRGSVVNNRPIPGTVAILIYPTHSEATIHNISEVVPSQLAPMACNQQPLSSHEINISGDISEMDYCMDYTGKLGDIDEGTLSVWKLSGGEWQELTPDQVLHDTSIICGNITKAQTPYMIAGFVPVVGVTPDLALASIKSADTAISRTAATGGDVELAQSLLAEAERAYVGCDYAGAKDLAERAESTVVGLPVIPIATVAALAGVAVVVGLAYVILRRKVRPRKKLD
jgi:hypothetical protein